mgnify:FL=1
MNFYTHEQAHVEIAGTQLVGTIQATPAEMLAAFGPPLFDVQPGVVSVEWRIMFEDGTVCTFYDWKELTRPMIGDVTVWRIGSNECDGHHLAHEAFRNALRTGIKQAA